MSYPLYPADPNRDPAEPFRNLDTGPFTRPVTTLERQSPGWDDAMEEPPLTTEEFVERQRERFGGVKVGSAFFGWVITAATAAILTALLAIAGVVLGLDLRSPVASIRAVLPLDVETVGWIGAGTLLVILFAAFYCGGYVAGRMARFSGVAQGIAVWVWALVSALAAGLAGFLFGDRFGVPRLLDVVQRVPVPEDLLVVAGIVAAAVVVAVSLGAAIIGGVVGVRYHRRVDRAADDA